MQALAKAGEELPRALSLPDESAVQAFVFHRFLTLLLLVPVTGAITFAGHSLVGEKLGRSLEPLLATPITTFELLVGKVIGALIPSLAVMLFTFAIYLTGIGVLAEPGVLGAMITPRTLLLVFGLGPMASLVALQVGVLVSARVNDPRTAQQFGALLILPLTGLFMAPDDRHLRADHGDDTAPAGRAAPGVGPAVDTRREIVRSGDDSDALAIAARDYADARTDVWICRESYPQILQIHADCTSELVVRCDV